MKTPRLRQAVLLVLVISLLGGFGYVVARTGPLAAVRVTVASPERRELQPALFGISTVEARRAYAIGPTSAGRLQQVWVDVGDVVTAGQLVADMDPVDLDDRIAAAQAALERAGNALTAAEAQVWEAVSRQELAEASARRFTDLRRRGFVTQEAADAKQYEANAARTVLVAAQANREAARRERERLLAEQAAAAKLRANLQLRTPVAGVVIAREAEPGSTVVAGQSVVRLIDPASLWLRVRIDQGRSAGLRVGLLADIELRSRPGERLPGKVARVELAGDSVTEEKIAQVAFDALPEGVALGELAEVTVRLPAIPNAPVLPNSAVQQQQGRTGVWLLTEDGKAQFQPLRFGIRDLDGAAQMLDGLPPDARVIVHSARELREGDAVKPSGELAGGRG
ncbi:MAG: efflux RND transporter periplasmic adaptor subunit [Candidatus Competibacter sp.]|nr:efflux RND transporter periplasmic adaptor subunit [Candidatus Competibacter sp.]MDS4058940.1 efflux RND transporter periplasmic adaptor subunit [Candidatus Contendobacter sp.]